MGGVVHMGEDTVVSWRAHWVSRSYRQSWASSWYQCWGLNYGSRGDQQAAINHWLLSPASCLFLFMFIVQDNMKFSRWFTLSEPTCHAVTSYESTIPLQYSVCGKGPLWWQVRTSSHPTAHKDSPTVSVWAGPEESKPCTLSGPQCVCVTEVQPTETGARAAEKCLRDAQNNTLINDCF